MFKEIKQEKTGGNIEIKNPGDLAIALESEENLLARQEMLNDFFTPERRQKMLESADQDVEGRPVRYYRRMNWDIFLKILKNGEVTALDHFQDPDAAIKIDELRHFLCRKIESDSEEDVYDKLDSLSFDEIVAMAMPGLSPAEKDILAHPTYRGLLPILNKHLDRKFMRHIHTGSSDQQFSSFLSMSVGGIILDNLRQGRIYVEMIIPNEEIEVHPEHARGEKEVLVKSLNADCISRAYIDSNQLWEEQVVSPESNIGKFCQKRGLQHYECVDRWRWDEPTEKYLPQKLIRGK